MAKKHKWYIIIAIYMSGKYPEAMIAMYYPPGTEDSEFDGYAVNSLQEAIDAEVSSCIKAGMPIVSIIETIVTDDITSIQASMLAHKSLKAIRKTIRDKNK